MADEPSNSPPPGDDPKSFTQAELDDMIEKRLQKERRQFSDYDDLKAKAEQFDQLENQNKSELERLQDEIRQRDERLATLPSQVQQNVVRFASLASQAGFLDPEDALLNLRDLDLGDADAVQGALGDLAERKPHLTRQGDPPPLGDGLPRRPKPGDGEPLQDESGNSRERAVAALRQMRHTR